MDEAVERWKGGLRWVGVHRPVSTIPNFSSLESPYKFYHPPASMFRLIFDSDVSPHLLLCLGLLLSGGECCCVADWPP